MHAPDKACCSRRHLSSSSALPLREREEEHARRGLWARQPHVLDELSRRLPRREWLRPARRKRIISCSRNTRCGTYAGLAGSSGWVYRCSQPILYLRHSSQVVTFREFWFRGPLWNTRLQTRKFFSVSFSKFFIRVRTYAYVCTYMLLCGRKGEHLFYFFSSFFPLREICSLF